MSERKRNSPGLGRTQRPGPTLCCIEKERCYKPHVQSSSREMGRHTHVLTFLVGQTGGQWLSVKGLSGASLTLGFLTVHTFLNVNRVYLGYKENRYIDPFFFVLML